MRAKFREHRAGVADSASAIGFELVPVGRQTENRTWVARTECTDDEVVHPLGILQHDEPGIVVKADCELLLACLAPIREQTASELWIGPRSGDDARTERGRA